MSRTPATPWGDLAQSPWAGTGNPDSTVQNSCHFAPCLLNERGPWDRLLGTWSGWQRAVQRIPALKMAKDRMIGAVRSGIRSVLPRRFAKAVSQSTRRSRLYFRELRGRHVIHLMHIRKTGGTAVKFALEPHREKSAHLLNLGTHETTLSRIPEGDKVAFFIRDPISRFVSGFNSRLREGRPRYYTPWTTQEADAFCRFPSPNDLAEGLDSRSRDTKADAVRAIYSIEHINLSYWYWFGSPELFDSRWKDIFFIGFQERLEEEITRL